jgi:DNA-directed RNA polymerase subunit K/omega
LTNLTADLVGERTVFAQHRIQCFLIGRARLIGIQVEELRSVDISSNVLVVGFREIARGKLPVKLRSRSVSNAAGSFSIDSRMRNPGRPRGGLNAEKPSPSPPGPANKSMIGMDDCPAFNVVPKARNDQLLAATSASLIAPHLRP